MTKEEYQLFDGILLILEDMKESNPAVEHIIRAQLQVLRDNLDEMPIEPFLSDPRETEG